jgi:hypothetical protein
MAWYDALWDWGKDNIFDIVDTAGGAYAASQVENMSIQDLLRLSSSNLVDSDDPFKTSRYSQIPGSDRFQQTVQFSPDVQMLFDNLMGDLQNPSQSYQAPGQFGNMLGGMMDERLQLYNGESPWDQPQGQQQQRPPRTTDEFTTPDQDEPQYSDGGGQQGIPGVGTGQGSDRRGELGFGGFGGGGGGQGIDWSGMPGGNTGGNGGFGNDSGIDWSQFNNQFGNNWDWQQGTPAELALLENMGNIGRGLGYASGHPGGSIAGGLAGNWAGDNMFPNTAWSNPADLSGVQPSEIQDFIDSTSPGYGLSPGMSPIGDQGGAGGSWGDITGNMGLGGWGQTALDNRRRMYRANNRT